MSESNTRVLSKYFRASQMRSHNRHWCWLHIDHVVVNSSISPMVFTSTWLWSTTFMFNEKSTSIVTSRYDYHNRNETRRCKTGCDDSKWKLKTFLHRLSATHIEWIVKFDSTATFTRAGINKLSRCITRTVWISSRTFTPLFDYRIRFLVDDGGITPFINLSFLT